MKGEKRCKKDPITIIHNKNSESILGSFHPFSSPYIKTCNILLGFDTILNQCYIRYNHSKGNQKNIGPDYETFVWIFKYNELSDDNEGFLLQKESSKIELKENMIINTGGCYLKVRLSK